LAGAVPMAVERDERLGALADHLEALGFALSGPEAAALRIERDRVVRLLRGVVARTAEPDAPLLIVVAGGSGAGKSTTVNTLAGAPVSAAGVLRPTTRSPTLVCHPDDRAWFGSGRVLPDLELRIVDSDALAPGVGLLDTPDIDSVELANHQLAAQALDAADGWLWLATSRTYADEVGMTYLRRARTRQALTVVVVTQVREHERAEVLDDVDRLLAAERIDPDLRTDIPHAEVADDRLSPEAVGPLREWLAALAPAGRRREVRAAASDGLVEALPAELVTLRDAVVQERRAAERLRASVRGHYAELPDQLDAELEAGLSLRADVLDRWQRLVGGNEAMLRVQTVIGQVGDVVRDRLGRPSQQDTRQVQVEVASELTRIVTRLLEHTGAAARRALEADPVGREVLDADPELRREDPERAARVREAIARWEDDVAERIETVGGPRKAQARRRSTELNAVATTAILVLFTLSGGLTGGEVGIAAAASAASQWLLVRMLGEQNVKRLLDEIGADLRRHVDGLAETDRARLDAAIEAASPPSEAAAALEAATLRADGSR
jgi:hypothetical protein